MTAALRHPSQSCPTPHGLWSLWELMLKKAALEFGRALADLRALELSCEVSRNHHPDVIHDNSDTLEKLTSDILGNLKRVCILADLGDVNADIDRFGAILNGRARIEDVKGRATALRERLYQELDSEFYFQVAREDVRLYGEKALFGTDVVAKFPKAANDIESAGKCLALREPTACVFHLMRAMEVVVRQLAGRLNITVTPQTTWRVMTGAMDGKIKGMSDATDKQKRRKNDWEAARANLHLVGSVWRNNTMHPATSYTRSQAHDVYNAVRVFMSGLAAL